VTPDPHPPRSVIEQFDLDPLSIQPLKGGWINLSFRALRQDGGDCILQRVNPIFPPAVNADIDAVTRHLHKKGLTTPLVIPTRSGKLWLIDEDDTWRLLSRVAGETHQTVATDGEAAEAGRVLGSFHLALADYAEPLGAGRLPVHQIERHLRNLRETLSEHEQHRALADVARISEQIFKLADRLQPLPDVDDRLVHGDPKISNVIFSEGRGVCLIDLDTLARTPVALEIGDALRSWCNPVGEDSAEASFSMARCVAALEGYRQGAPGLLSAAEWQAIPDATLSIALELAARFAADALNESYFAWDRQRFDSASQHNLARARAQLALAGSIAGQLPAMRELVVTLM
jgi:Ser/Thr protein kinase RdoA (MazF antagonist)